MNIEDSRQHTPKHFRSYIVQKNYKTQFSFLEAIARYLNRRDDWPSDLSREREAWNAVAKIVSAMQGDVPSEPMPTDNLFTARNLCPDPMWGVMLYNQYFGGAHVRLAVAWDKRRNKPMPYVTFPKTGYEPFVHAALNLWKHYFEGEGWLRLKPCWQCHRWFVDRGHNRIARFCKYDNGKCNERWWNRRDIRRVVAANRKRMKGGGIEITRAGKKSTKATHSLITWDAAVSILEQVAARKRKRQLKAKRS